MSEDLVISGSTREEHYTSLIPQLKALVTGEDSRVANLGNIAAALKETLNFFWVGYYIVDGDKLVLGPFQGPVACTRITKGKGVCGDAWQKEETILVPNVDEYDGHIACSSMSRSEIVIPGFDKDGNVIFVLDVDSENLNNFSEVDEKYLSEVVRLIESIW